MYLEIKEKILFSTDLSNSKSTLSISTISVFIFQFSNSDFSFT
nr:MAG TPA: hypothetical protein [Caudoviricetes sp.]